MSRNEKYRFSFTASSVQLPDFARLAQLAVVAGYDSDKINRDDLGKEKEGTNIRQARELKIRLKHLTVDELDILADGALSDKRIIALVAVCKTYGFIKDFIVDVLREKATVYDYEIRESDYNAFVNRRIYDHPELEELSMSSQKKIKQVLFLILEETGIINNSKDRIIQLQVCSQKVMQIIAKDNPELLKLLFKTDEEIQEAIRNAD